MKKRTLGGLQTWADVFYFEGWRIQKNAKAEEYRLLDQSNQQHFAGSEKECLEHLKNLLDNPKLEPEKQTSVVLLLHGIIRTRHSMAPLVKPLNQEGFRCYTVAYPSTILPIEEHAKHLNQIISRLAEAHTVHFVCHSMGGLVVRTFLAKHPDDRVKRVVMLGTPNKGAEKADFWSQLGAYRWLLGPAGMQLVTKDGGASGWLPPALENVEVGIVAGGRGNDRGFSFSLEGDDDGTVTVESTKLQGATDFIRLPVIHPFLPSARRAKEVVVRFLTKGYFVSAEERQPIPLETEKVKSTSNPESPAKVP